MPELAPTQEDAERFIIRRLREAPSDCAQYGYEVYLPHVMRAYIGDRIGKPWRNYHEVDPFIPEAAVIFYAAAWELCRRGILRPGVKQYMEQVTPDGSAGNGYSLTLWGKKWLTESDSPGYVPTEPVRFVELLKPFAPQFGPGFLSRGNEAVVCYQFGAYLACCVMCGAAVESILLALAITKAKGAEDKVLKEYATAGGRTKIERRLAAGLPPHLQDQFRVPLSLLKYWRDESGHGRPSTISEIEAYTSLALLLRAAQFAKDNYSALTRP